MVLNDKYDDQGPMLLTLRSNWSKKYKFRWLSSNWFFASHGITEEGVFSGPGRCYRSSVIVTGPVRWVHGHFDDCSMMNGKQNEFAFRPRCYFKSGYCNTTKTGYFPLFSEKELKQTVYPYTLPDLRWAKMVTHDSTSLFW